MKAGGQYLHFFHGFHLDGVLVIRFGFAFAIAMLIFAAMFWAIGRPK
jgi:hypothetical protein